MKYVLFVALFFLSLCFPNEKAVAETINLDSGVLGQLPWEHHPESDLWLKFLLDGEKETVIIIEKVLLSDNTNGVRNASLQFTISTTCLGKGVTQLVSWISGSSVADVLHCDGREGEIPIQPIFEQSLYPLPKDALDYLADNHG